MTNTCGLRLVYVDDEKNALLNCKAVVDGISNVCNAEFFQSPLDAITHAENNNIDVAFLDIDMPEMSGFELAKKLQEINKNTKVAFVTGNISYMRPSNRPVDLPFIFKPYTNYDVTDVLEQMM